MKMNKILVYWNMNCMFSLLKVSTYQHPIVRHVFSKTNTRPVKQARYDAFNTKGEASENMANSSDSIRNIINLCFVHMLHTKNHTTNDSQDKKNEYLTTMSLEFGNDAKGPC